MTSLIAENGDVVDYLCRSLIDSTPTGVRIVDSLVEIATRAAPVEPATRMTAATTPASAASAVKAARPAS
ncbi:hypothetical protein, partial [Mycobacterium sp.]|uniref:hypothetical protein n=1 Tax=Mycobacterium sp. TaxID=1785 RepID=UPI003C708C15